jgi:hypothetical protein
VLRLRNVGLRVDEARAELHLTWGQCYDHYFWRFCPIFGKTNWRFSRKFIIQYIFYIC